MKKVLITLIFVSSATAFAAPTISDVSLLFDGDPATSVRVNYTLNNEPAVVTVDFQEKVNDNWTSIGGKRIGDVGGDANQLVLKVGSPSVAYWFPPADGSGSISSGNLRAVVKAWPTNQPPDYMTVDLTKAASNHVTRFYATTNDLPGGLENRAYKTTHLLMRKIPAEGVVWLMGSATNEAFRTQYKDGFYGSDAHYGRLECQHKVMLTDDYYAGVFEVTQGQYYNIADTLHSCTFTDNVDSEILPFQEVMLSQLRGQVKGDYTTYFPQNGHNVTTNSVIGKLRKKCGIADIDLPTEAQWEYAARGGAGKMLPAPLPDGYDFIDSNYRWDHIGKVAWHSYNASGAYTNKSGVVTTKKFPHPGGLKLCNGFGLYDTMGNVYEACLGVGWSATNDDAEVAAYVATLTPGWEPDENGSFVNSSVTTNPVGIAAGSANSAGRVPFRGGNYYEAHERLFRNGARSVQGHDFVFGAYLGFKGFRLFCSVKEAAK